MWRMVEQPIGGLTHRNDRLILSLFIKLSKIESVGDRMKEGKYEKSSCSL
jgi:hypothetical protein